MSHTSYSVFDFLKFNQSLSQLGHHCNVTVNTQRDTIYCQNNMTHYNNSIYNIGKDAKKDSEKEIPYFAELREYVDEKCMGASIGNSSCVDDTGRRGVVGVQLALDGLYVGFLQFDPFLLAAVRTETRETIRR